jgi:hypothetical protein
LNLAEQSQLSLAFSEKYHHQKIWLILLVSMLSCSLLFIIYCFFQAHRKRLNHHYDEIELPQNHSTQAVQTKRWYQQQYKVARKYQYNISVAYLKVENWQELNFCFNRKVLARCWPLLLTKTSMQKTMQVLLVMGNTCFSVYIKR